MTSLVLYRAGGVGDTLLIVPVLRALRAHYPHAVISFIGNTEAATVLRCAGLIDDIYSADHPALAGLSSGDPLQATALRRVLGDPDLAIVYTIRTAQASTALAALGVPALVASPLPPPGVHTGIHLLQALEPLGILTHNWHQQYVNAPLRLRAQTTVHEGKRPIFLHPGAGAEWKRWPATRFATLTTILQQQGHEVVVIEGPADSGCVAAMGWRGAVVCERSLSELALLLREGSAYVGNDSGITHLAALLGVPTIALFGPTHPLTWAPLGPRVRVLRVCQQPPASDIRICYDTNCLAAISVELVLTTIQELLGG
jgi:heptosyltransferase-3